MYCIVLGAGLEGERFIEIAIAQDHEVTLIDSDEEKARQLLKNNDIRVLIGSIAKTEILQEAEIDRADALIATTHDDAHNLMAMVLAKEHDIPKRVCLVNDKAHSKIFEDLDAKVVNDPASIIAHQLFDLLD